MNVTCQTSTSDENIREKKWKLIHLLVDPPKYIQKIESFNDENNPSNKISNYVRPQIETSQIFRAYSKKSFF